MEQDAGFDRPRTKDRFYRDLEYWGGETPAVVDLSSWVVIYNQWADDYTKMACGSYSQIHGTNTHNTYNVEGMTYDPYKHRELFVEKYKTDDYDPIEKWSSIQDQLDFQKKKSYITGRVKIFTAQECEENLIKWRTIVTGSKKIDRKKTKTSAGNIAVIGTWAAHLVVIVWYDRNKELLRCMNSYWPNYMDNGFFYVKYSDIPSLYSMYALLDKKDLRTINQWRMKIFANQRAKKMWGKVYWYNPSNWRLEWYLPTN
jgi:hypothetical protein